MNYYKKNKEKLLYYQNNYYQKNKEKQKEKYHQNKIECKFCNQLINKHYFKKHQQTKLCKDTKNFYEVD